MILKLFLCLKRQIDFRWNFRSLYTILYHMTGLLCFYIEHLLLFSHFLCIYLIYIIALSSHSPESVMFHLLNEYMIIYVCPVAWWCINVWLDSSASICFQRKHTQDLKMLGEMIALWKTKHDQRMKIHFWFLLCEYSLV